MPRDLPLPAGEQPHIWWLRAGNLRGAAAFVTDSEMRRAAEFHQPADRVRFVEGRAFVRLALGSYAGIPTPREIQFETRPHGKPHLRQAPANVDFSFSSTPGLYAIAVATGARVGLDVELMTRSAHMRRALLRALSPQDSNLPAYKNVENLEMLLKNWVAKEALLKGVGVGLSRDPRDIHLGSGAGQSSFSWQAAAADPDFGDSNWTVISLSIAPGYAGALAMEGAAKEVLISRFVI